MARKQRREGLMAAGNGKPQKQARLQRGNPNPPPPPVEHRFKPGQSGNPGGKPVNARNAITRKFLEVLAKDFEEGGEAAVKAARETDPMGYVRAVASLLPKEFVEVRPLEAVTDEELAAMIADYRQRLQGGPETHVGSEGSQTTH
jgi:hypothetical protein